MNIKSGTNTKKRNIQEMKAYGSILQYKLRTIQNQKYKYKKRRNFINIHIFIFKIKAEVIKHTYINNFSIEKIIYVCMYCSMREIKGRNLKVKTYI